MTATQRFKEHFGYSPPRRAALAGSLVLLGNHMHACQGLSLTTTVSAQTEFVGSPTRGPCLEILSAARPDMARLPISRPENPSSIPDWAAPLQETITGWKQHGLPLRPCHLACASTIPARDWMGGMAACRLAFCLVYRELFPFTLTPTGCSAPPERDARDQLPRLTNSEKLTLAGLGSPPTGPPGSQAQDLTHALTALFGQPGRALELDFHTQTVEPVDLPPDHLLVAAFPRLSPDAATYPQNPWLPLLTRTAQTLGRASLRTLETKELKPLENKLNARELACATHVARENRRVLSASRALREGDATQFGQYLQQSHQSARNLLQPHRPELDRLIQIAGTHRACLGSKLSSYTPPTQATLHLVLRNQAEEFMHSLQTQYPLKPGDYVKPVAFELAP